MYTHLRIKEICQNIKTINLTSYIFFSFFNFEKKNELQIWPKFESNF